MTFLVDRPRSIIPALDCDIAKAVEICRSLRDVEAVAAVKIGSWKGALWDGLVNWSESLYRAFGHSPQRVKFIYDHQKGATDIPDLEDAMALFHGEVEAVILFPFGGRETQRRWTDALLAAQVTPIVGGHMTQPGFLYSDGGYIHDDAPERIYRLAVYQGVRDFVVPGNRPELVQSYKAVIEDELSRQGCAGEEFALYAPGFVKQGGVISDTGKVAGSRWHAIVGRDILNSEDPAATARELASQLG